MKKYNYSVINDIFLSSLLLLEKDKLCRRILFITENWLILY